MFIMIIPTFRYFPILFKGLEKQKCQFNSIVISLISNNMKVFCYIFHKFNHLIFGQSLLLFLVSFLLICLNSNVDQPNPDFPFMNTNIQRFLSFRSRIQNFGRFFNLFDSKSFIEFIYSYTICVIIFLGIFFIFYYLINADLTTNLILLFGNLFDSIKFIPIFYDQMNNSRCQTKSKYFFNYTVPDITKIAFFVYLNAQYQFIIESFIQFIIDSAFIILLLMKFSRVSNSQSTSEISQTSESETENESSTSSYKEE